MEISAARSFQLAVYLSGLNLAAYILRPVMGYQETDRFSGGVIGWCALFPGRLRYFLPITRHPGCHRGQHILAASMDEQHLWDHQFCLDLDPARS